MIMITTAGTVRETVKTAWLSFDDINNEQTFDLETFRGVLYRRR